VVLAEGLEGGFVHRLQCIASHRFADHPRHA
jgi:hypothetical protein